MLDSNLCDERQCDLQEHLATDGPTPVEGKLNMLSMRVEGDSFKQIVIEGRQSTVYQYP